MQLKIAVITLKPGFWFIGELFLFKFFDFFESEVKFASKLNNVGRSDIPAYIDHNLFRLY